MRAPGLGAWIACSFALVFACVVVPPPQSPPQPVAAQQPQPSSGGPYGGAAYGGATYGVNACGAMGGATYGGASCGSWMGDSMPGLFNGQVVGYALGLAAMRGNGAEPCRIQMSYRGCVPAIGAIATLTFSNGATMSGTMGSTGQFIFRGVTAGSYRVRVEYLGIALESTFSLDAGQAAAGQAMGAAFSPADFR